MSADGLLGREELADRIATVLDEIDTAARVVGRDPAAVRLVAVTKTVDPRTVALAHECGLRRFGENRAQELLAKATVLPADCEWHMIGAVQTNKVRALADRVHTWHTLDRSALAAELARRAPGARVLVEVNVGAEAAKAGCARDELDPLVEQARALGLDVRGLMCVPPAGADPAPYFAWLQEAADRLGLPELSMGMSADLAVAVRHGATFVRIGTALFGPRRTADGVRH